MAFSHSLKPVIARFFSHHQKSSALSHAARSKKSHRQEIEIMHARGKIDIDAFWQFFVAATKGHSAAEILHELPKLSRREYAAVRVDAAKLCDRRVEQLDALVNYRAPQPEPLKSLKSLGRNGEAEPAHDFPEPSDIIFHGLAGDIVRRIEPHTEADPVALLVQILTMFGNVIGRDAYAKS
jgi:hypothetical protein